MIYDTRSEIIKLVELDQRIAQLTQELSELTAKKAYLEGEKAQVVGEVDLAHKKAHDLQLKIDGLELELRSLEQKQGRTKEKLLTVGSQKELDSLRHEEENLSKQREEFDEQGLEMLLDLEPAQKDAALLKAAQPQKVQIIQTELDELDGRTAHVKKMIVAYTDQRVELVLGVPDDFLEAYASMMKRMADPVLPVIKDACSGCSSSLRSSELAKVRTGEFIPCQGCYRTMYLFRVESDDE